MNTTEFTGWLDVLKSQAGVIAILAFIIFSGFKRWWVFGWVYDAEIRRTEEYKIMTYRLMGITKKAVAPGKGILEEWGAP